jgi:hypothetical protein
MIRLGVADQPDPAAMAAARAALARLARPTYLGWSARTAVAVAAVAVAAGIALGIALPSPDACTLVEDGPTGPEPSVTLSRMTYRCTDHYVHVTYRTSDPSEVVDVQRSPLAPCGYVVEGGEMVPASCIPAADLQHRLDVIRAERSGGRW